MIIAGRKSLEQIAGMIEGTSKIRVIGFGTRVPSPQ